LTVYAIIENVGVVDEALRKCFADGFGTEGGSPTVMFRSNDAGKTWKQVAPAPVPAAPAAPAAAGAGAGRGAGGGRGAAAGPPAGPCTAAHQAAAANRAGGGGGGRGFDGGNPGYYYSQVRVDPNDKETVYVLSVGWSRS
jgi:hypothetical protein